MVCMGGEVTYPHFYSYHMTCNRFHHKTAFLNTLEDGSDISRRDVHLYFNKLHVRCYSTWAVQYAMGNLPFNDHACVAICMHCMLVDFICTEMHAHIGLNKLTSLLL